MRGLRASVGLRHSLAACLLALLLALAANGCGDNGDSSTASTSATSTSEAEESYRGGEASIEDFGSEAAGAERAALLEAFHGYAAALGNRDYAAACFYLGPVVRSGLRQLWGKRGEADCPKILPTALAPTAPALIREQSEGEITKVRVEDDRAFIIFHAPGAKLYQQTMELMGGEWKLNTVGAAVLVPLGLSEY